jgi:hypothetical protein
MKQKSPFYRNFSKWWVVDKKERNLRKGNLADF